MNRRQRLIAFVWQRDFLFYVVLVIVGKALADLTQRDTFDLFRPVEVMLRHPSVQVFAVLVAIGVALILFWAKRNARKGYAAIEFLVAVAAIWSAIRPDGTRLVTFERGLKLLGGVYIMIRSFDNLKSTPTRAQPTASVLGSAAEQAVAADNPAAGTSV
jgi:hypothetical protein